MDSEGVEQVSAKSAIEAVLSDRAMTETGFLERVILDPSSTIRQIIEETLNDDGELDLDHTNISVHVETDRHLHFVITLSEQQELADVSGFAAGGKGRPGLAGGLKSFNVVPPILGSVGTSAHTDAYLCTASGVCACSGDECNP